MSPATTPVPYRLGLVLGCLTGALVPAAVQADEPIDSLMYHSPEFPTPRVVRTYSEKLPGLWLQALDRPEVELRCQAALAIAKAREGGMSGLDSTIPALKRELSRADQQPSVRLAVARALIALDAKDVAPELFKQASSGEDDLRDLLEPTLARWGYGPARETWLQRLDRPPPSGRGMVLAIQALTTLKEEKAWPRLRELVLSGETSAAVRLEAAKALGILRTTGGEADADQLAADPSPRGLLGRLAAASVLRKHSGDEAVQRLQKLARDSEPSIVAIAVARLIEIDPALVEPDLADILANPDANVRTLGVEVLARRSSEKNARLLGDRLADAHPDIRALARRTLLEYAKSPDLKAAVIMQGVRVLGNTDWRGQEQAALLLAKLDHKPAAERLVELLKDSRAEVAIAAAWALRVLAEPKSLPKVLDYFSDYSSVKPTGVTRLKDTELDRQLSHLAQLLGESRYAPAEAVLRSLIPPRNPPMVPVPLLETRAAACWSLGLLHEGNAVPELTRALAGRIEAIATLPPEDNRVRWMCAVSLGRMKAKEGLPSLRKFNADGKYSLNAVNNACGWAIEQITGEKVIIPETLKVPQSHWFLYPLDP